MNEATIAAPLAETIPTGPVVTRIYLTHTLTPWSAHGFDGPLKVHAARVVLEWRANKRVCRADLGLGTGLCPESAVRAAVADVRHQRPGSRRLRKI